ncbi:capsid protein [Streptococcus phage Javan237]|uniref:phage major capsid protein n=1 Tax=Streptococcus gallolyticus TaxID=315405 RepID=UPI000891692C|nr:phage major capsid protein [Streptococcus gallolyticus]QBX16218.1 capsid protein [Streptococcus phage Javan237]QBX25092.1 capsid protein [Streptococcus phage Javan238]SDJ74430.1 phage major capsid protein, HK97 family [Streptococcus gallolyticus]SDL24837.1 phage major capsid protein, HK97 family [Streptococcus gallolyticus]
MNINELNNLWIEAGHQVEDLNEKMNVALQNDNFSEEEFKNLKEERDTAKMRRDELKNQLEEARTNARVQDVLKMDDKDVKLTSKEKVVKDAFIKNFKALVTGHFSNASSPATTGLMSSSREDNTAGNGGLTIPKDVRTAIIQLTRQYDNLQDLVTVEATEVPEGSRNIETFSTITPLQKVDDEDTDIKDFESPKAKLIKYAISEFAGVITVTNSLLKDSAENILAWLEDYVAKKVVVTRNAAVIDILGKAPKKATLTTWDDIKDLYYDIDPALRSNGIWVTNTAGIKALAKVKNNDGDPVLQHDPTQEDVYLIEGKRIREVADRWLSDTAKDTHPLYFGDYKAYATLFDREHMELAYSDSAGNAFYRNQRKLRVIDRFDIQVVDEDAIAVGSFSKIADVVPTAKTETAGA